MMIMYEVPPDENIIIEERKIPTNEESLAKAISEIDIDAIRANYLVSDFSGLAGIKNFILSLLQPELVQAKKFRLLQLEFLEQVKDLTETLPVRERTYVLLGAFQYAQGRWLPFPNYGPLLELELKRADLVQIISENDERIKLEKLFDNPQLVNKAADRAFAHFLEQHSELHKLERKI